MTKIMPHVRHCCKTYPDVNEPYSVGRCVIRVHFLVKVSNIHFLVEKCILFKKKDVYNFSLAF